MRKKLSSKKSILKKIDISSMTAPVIGVDEVGRGCIAGPVCAGVVIFNLENLTPESFESYIDSKKIPEIQRELISREIHSHHYTALGWSSVEEIDELNIRQASLLAMKRAVILLAKKMNLKVGTLLIDGRDTLPELIPDYGSISQLAIVKGDNRVKQISAASIIAKVARDQLMKQMAVQHPQYCFDKHKGYGTEVHRNAIQKWGVLSCHRKSFGGVKEYIKSN